MEVFLNVALKTIYAGNSLKVIGEFVYDKLWFPNFDLQKDNFNFLLQCVATPLLSTGHKTSLK